MAQGAKRYLKIWLDDERVPPDASWDWFDNAFNVIETLKQLHQHILCLSLDHDLGDESKFGNGYLVMKWLEEKVYTDADFICPAISIHTQNPVARDKMVEALKSINRKRNQEA